MYICICNAVTQRQVEECARAKDLIDSLLFLARADGDRIELASQVLEAAPEVGGRWNARYIAGIGRRGEAFVVVAVAKAGFATTAVTEYSAGSSASSACSAIRSRTR